MPSILVAEDSFSLANLLEVVLKQSGFEVFLAHRGDHAAAEAQRTAFDILVLDQQMPGMTGIEVLRSVRCGGPNQASPAYLCTAKSHELNIVELQMELEIDGVFNKPFSPRDLIDTLLMASRSLDRRRAKAELAACS